MYRIMQESLEDKRRREEQERQLEAQEREKYKEYLRGLDERKQEILNRKLEKERVKQGIYDQMKQRREAEEAERLEWERLQEDIRNEEIREKHRRDEEREERRAREAREALRRAEIEDKGRRARKEEEARRLESEFKRWG